MIPQPQPADGHELLDLAVRYLDGDLTADELSRLQARLAADPSSRQMFVGVCLEAKLIAEKLGNRLHDSPAVGAAVADDGPSVVAAPAGSPWLGFLNSALRGIPGGEFVVGLLVVFAVLAAGWGLAQLREHLAGRQPPPVGGLAASHGYLATLTSCENCRWTPRGLPTEHAARLGPGELELQSGVAEITFDCGARTVIEGPALLRLEAPTRAHLQYGRVVAHVPSAARGFTVASPSVVVVDLGTEFGLDVDLAGAAELHVFTGRVEAHATAAHVDARPLVLGVAATARFDRASDVSRGTDGPNGEFVRQVKQPRLERARLALVEEGGTFGAGNLATETAARAFAINVVSAYPRHQIRWLNDGRYGNDYSWIGLDGGPSWAGIDLGGRCRIDGLAFGRDNNQTAQEAYRDRWQGSYKIQYTTVENPDERTADEHWRTIDTVKFDPSMPQIVSEHIRPYLRHRFRFAPVLATGVRIVTSKGGLGIDELEIYGTRLSD